MNGSSSRSVEEYEKIVKIGSGTYGLVWKARCKKSHEIVALKKIKMEAEREGFPITALREMNILKSLNHDNVIRLRDVVTTPKPGISGWFVYLVFDYVDHDMSGLLDSPERFTVFSVDHVKCLFKQLLLGLNYLHQNNVMHRDLKAANVLIGNDGILKLADFGLSRKKNDQFSDDDSTSKYTNKVVTLWYRPPELLLGSENYGVEVDIWSAGCILAELLLLDRKALFPGESEMEQLELIFKLMGTPTESVWPDMKYLPWYRLYHPKQIHSSNFKNKFKNFPDSATNLLSQLLTLDPKRRISAKQALESDFFTTLPLPSQPHQINTKQSSSCNEFNTKKRRAQQQQEAIESVSKRSRTNSKKNNNNNNNYNNITFIQTPFVHEPCMYPPTQLIPSNVKNTMNLLTINNINYNLYQSSQPRRNMSATTTNKVKSFSSYEWPQHVPHNPQSQSTTSLRSNAHTYDPWNTSCIPASATYDKGYAALNYSHVLYTTKQNYYYQSVPPTTAYRGPVTDNIYKNEENNKSQFNIGSNTGGGGGGQYKFYYNFPDHRNINASEEPCNSLRESFSDHYGYPASSSSSSSSLSSNPSSTSSIRSLSAPHVKNTNVSSPTITKKITNQNNSNLHHNNHHHFNTTNHSTSSASSTSSSCDVNAPSNISSTLSRKLCHTPPPILFTPCNFSLLAPQSLAPISTSTSMQTPTPTSTHTPTTPTPTQTPTPPPPTSNCHCNMTCHSSCNNLIYSHRDTVPHHRDHCKIQTYPANMENIVANTNNIHHQNQNQHHQHQRHSNSTTKNTSNHNSHLPINEQHQQHQQRMIIYSKQIQFTTRNVTRKSKIIMVLFLHC
eukprot:TRINITY_DN251_c1_g2_i1.p1 TRINITY_DN251_c1_g2~~TRINITY_DN251_c1_g2_i1.p1  ORF type:complete len:840 (+),score=194.96 TRINITY_DN251_c1_g2_i1:24-2543(+)